MHLRRAVSGSFRLGRIAFNSNSRLTRRNLASPLTFRRHYEAPPRQIPRPDYDHGLGVWEMNQINCKSYALIDYESKEAMIVDPVREKASMYLAFFAYHHATLKYIVDTHSHADHFSDRELQRLTGAHYAMHDLAPSPAVTKHLKHNDLLSLGRNAIRILETPGHTPDSISLYTGRTVLTGDALFVSGCGRTDFAGGDPGQLYDSVHGRLFSLPEETLVLPAHDYRFNTHTTIGREKSSNPRLTKSREEFIEIMRNLGLPLPEKIMEALQVNVSALMDNEMSLPTYSQLNEVKLISPDALKDMLRSEPENLIVVDVREQSEFAELPPIPGSINIPLNQIVKELPKIQVRAKGLHHPIILCVCRVGVRSSTAASILSAHNVGDVRGLKGGLLAFHK
ncbi:beta-lactamase-like protein [Cladochytrium replicatum]|nr:beta-lactamase-like protein [Cladochytrium replicatum]